MASSFSFDIKSSSLESALWFESYFRTSLLKKIRGVSQWIFLIAVLGFLLVFIPQLVSEDISRKLLAVVFLIFAYTATIFLLERFGDHLKNTRISFAELNTANLLSFEAMLSVHEAMQYAKRKNLIMLDSSVLLYFLLKERSYSQFLFQRALLDLKEFEDILYNSLSSLPVNLVKKEPLYGEDFQRAITLAMEQAKKAERMKVEFEDLFVALAMVNPIFKQYLIEQGFIPERDMANIAAWHLRLRTNQKERKKFWLKKNLSRYKSLGKNWAAGYTITLDQFSYDISDQVRTMNFPKAVDHTQEKKQIERILSRQHTNNVLLVGNPGSGRNRLIEDFASKSVLEENKNEDLNHRRIVQLDLSHLLASIQTLEEAEFQLTQIFQEVVAAGNIILVIDDFHNFVGDRLTSAPGRINIAGVLASYLRLPQFPFIAITTYAGLHRYLERNPSLLSFFEIVEVSELSTDKTLEVLQEIAPYFEHTYKKFISYPAMQATVAFADKYIQATPFPKKAIDLLDESTSLLANTAGKILLPAHVATVVSERTQIPVGEIEEGEREVLLDLEKLIHQRIVNQKEAVKEVAAALRRARTEIASRKGPMGSFLFLGPTGVGKTETAKALASIYFGSEKRMIRLDMSEFQKIEDIDRLLGTTTQNGLLTTSIREDPFSLLLLDELEKAHPNVVNLFLQVLDEGYITDGLGRKIDFRHTVIIATSNAGYRLILEAIKKQTDFASLKQRMLEYLFEKGIYRPEFLNRFDGVILFTPLEQEHLIAIAALMLQKLQKNLEEKGIELVITEQLKTKIAKLGYDPTFGARSMRRVLQDKVENALAVALLSKSIKRGQRVTVDPNDFTVKIL